MLYLKPYGYKYVYIFVEYFEVVTNSLATYNSECVFQIKKANRIINLLLKSNHGTKIIENKFK